jgi:hypothetical protein
MCSCPATILRLLHLPSEGTHSEVLQALNLFGRLQETEQIAQSRSGVQRGTEHASS